MRRRDFLKLGAGLAGAASLSACKHEFSLEEGLKGDCRTLGDLSRNPLVSAAWEGLAADRVWDVHVHLFGDGRSRSGIWVDPPFDHPAGPESYLRKTMFMNGGCIRGDGKQADAAMVERLATIAGEFPTGARFVLLAFDFTYDETGRRREEWTTFSVSNDYAQRVATAHPDRFEWNASVHPYRPDALEALRAAKAAGARAVKWLPPTMGIDLRARQCLPFYDALAELDMPLLVHLGEERAVAGARREDLANPLHARVPLERGVRVIAAHCATLGESHDLDVSPDPARAPKVGNFDLFARLMADRRYEGRLFGDISAITQYNRIEALPRVLAALPKWNGRVLNGSDYPLPGILPLYSMNAMVKAGVLDQRLVPALHDLHQGNALAFDFVLKRNLRLGATRIPRSAFETRDFFVSREVRT
jgi:mannonate dehydratase